MVWRREAVSTADGEGLKVELTGTVRGGGETETSRITASGATYDEAREALEALIPEGSALIAIRTDLEG
ncbi:hypothetical protein GCM10009582_13500 [Arthrobacter flavus]